MLLFRFIFMDIRNLIKQLKHERHALPRDHRLAQARDSLIERINQYAASRQGTINSASVDRNSCLRLFSKFS